MQKQHAEQLLISRPPRAGKLLFVPNMASLLALPCQGPDSMLSRTQHM
jgi:NAD(P)-dependent dehydrogenase (short-subunit alcohol dehydrogenase family)